MKRILVIGIVLLALLALTGGVSAATEGTAVVWAHVDIPQESIDLTVENNIPSEWTLGLGDNTIGDFSGGGIHVMFQQANCQNGITVKMADRLDENKPVGTEGKLVGISSVDGYHSDKVLTNPLQFSSNWPGFSGFQDITGTDTVMANLDPMWTSGGFSLRLKQVVTPSAQNGNYRIILTFTATPN